MSKLNLFRVTTHWHNKGVEGFTVVFVAASNFDNAIERAKKFGGSEYRITSCEEVPEQLLIGA